MTHITRARKERGAKLVVVDPYRTGTAAVADMHLAVRPGTDAALACAVMHVAFRDGYADRDYLARLSDFPAALEAHLAARSPEWAAAITGLPVEQIEDFAKLYCTTQRSLYPHRLWLRALAQRRGVDARGDLSADGHRQVAARGRRRAVELPQHLQLGQDADRGARCARSGNAHPRHEPARPAC